MQTVWAFLLNLAVKLPPLSYSLASSFCSRSRFWSCRVPAHITELALLLDIERERAREKGQPFPYKWLKSSVYEMVSLYMMMHRTFFFFFFLLYILKLISDEHSRVLHWHKSLNRKKTTQTCMPIPHELDNLRDVRSVWTWPDILTSMLNCCLTVWGILPKHVQTCRHFISSSGAYCLPTDPIPSLKRQRFRFYVCIVNVTVMTLTVMTVVVA